MCIDILCSIEVLHVCGVVWCHIVLGVLWCCYVCWGWYGSVGELYSVGSAMCVLGSYTVLWVCVLGVVCDRRRARLCLMLGWSLLGWGLYSSCQSPNCCCSLLPRPPQPDGDEAAGPPLLSSLTLMWGWDWLPAQYQEARGQARSDNLGSKHLCVGWCNYKGLALGAVLCAYKYLKKWRICQILLCRAHWRDMVFIYYQILLQR